jgi:hypothetical protein
MLARHCFDLGSFMRRSIAIVLAAACLSACASSPPSPTAAATPQQVASADPAAKKDLICHEEPGTGTHIRRPVRICATAEEWARRREESQKAMGDISRRAGQSAPGGR